MYTSSPEHKTVWILKNMIFEKYFLNGCLRHNSYQLYAKCQPDPSSVMRWAMMNQSGQVVLHVQKITSEPSILLLSFRDDPDDAVNDILSANYITPPSVIYFVYYHIILLRYGDAITLNLWWPYICDTLEYIEGETLQ